MTKCETDKSKDKRIKTSRSCLMHTCDLGLDVTITVDAIASEGARALASRVMPVKSAMIAYSSDGHWLLFICFHELYSIQDGSQYLMVESGEYTTPLTASLNEVGVLCYTEL